MKMHLLVHRPTGPAPRQRPSVRVCDRDPASRGHVPSCRHRSASVPLIRSPISAPVRVPVPVLIRQLWYRLPCRHHHWVPALGGSRSRLAQLAVPGRTTSMKRPPHR